MIEYHRSVVLVLHQGARRTTPRKSSLRFRSNVERYFLPDLPVQAWIGNETTVKAKGEAAMRRICLCAVFAFSVVCERCGRSTRQTKAGVFRWPPGSVRAEEHDGNGADHR